MEILAEVSSRGRRKGRPRDLDDIRWAELTIYYSDNDAYVVEVVRCSDVYHTLTNACRAYEADRVKVPARDLEETDRPCYRCKPPMREDLAPDDVVLAEEDRDETRRAPDAETLVDVCCEMTGDGTTMTDLAKRGLLAAGGHDPNVRHAYEEEMRRMKQSKVAS